MDILAEAAPSEIARPAGLSNFRRCEARAMSPMFSAFFQALEFRGATVNARRPSTWRERSRTPSAA